MAVHSGVLFSSVCLLHVTQKVKTLILRSEATRQRLRAAGPGKATQDKLIWPVTLGPANTGERNVYRLYKELLTTS